MPNKSPRRHEEHRVGVLCCKEGPWLEHEVLLGDLHLKIRENEREHLLFCTCCI